MYYKDEILRGTITFDETGGFKPKIEIRTGKVLTRSSGL